MTDARKDIVFRGEDCREKFRIKDGDSIKITAGYDGRESIYKCRWIDEMHMNVGTTAFHMDEFMETQVRAGNRYAPVPNPAPKLDILFVEPGQNPRDVEIPPSMTALRELVGGELVISPLGYNTVTVHGLTGPAQEDKSEVFAVCGLNEGLLASLHPYSAQQYRREFAPKQQTAEQKPSLLRQLADAKKAAEKPPEKAPTPGKGKANPAR